jgi:hypothetical protein
METHDGLFIIKEMKGPLPSSLIDEAGSWWPLINRWLAAVIGLEKHHGSRGSSMVAEIISAPASSKADEDAKMTSVDSASPQPGVTQEGPSSASRTNPPPVEDSGRASQARRLPMDRDSSDGSDDENMEVDEPVRNNRAGIIRFFGENHVVDEDLDDSDEDLIEEMEMDEAEEMVGFADQLLGNAGFGAGRHAPTGNEEDSADEPSSSGSDGEGDTTDASYVFASVSLSPIVSYQPSLLAVEKIGPGRQGSVFEAGSASAVMADLSHLGLIHRKSTPTFSLIRLPKSFVELYGIVNKVKGRDEATTVDEADDVGSAETAICLLTGAVMRSGSSRRAFSRAQRPPGACTLHARKHGSGIGIFFLVQKCTVLLMHNNKSAYSASLYVDEHGEEDHGLRRGRPLFLNDARYRALEQLWRQQGIPREVAQIRSTSDRVIRDNWY